MCDSSEDSLRLIMNLFETTDAAKFYNNIRQAKRTTQGSVMSCLWPLPAPWLLKHSVALSVSTEPAAQTYSIAPRWHLHSCHLTYRNPLCFHPVQYCTGAADQPRLSVCCRGLLFCVLQPVPPEPLVVMCNWAAPALARRHYPLLSYQQRLRLRLYPRLLLDLSSVNMQVR